MNLGFEWDLRWFRVLMSQEKSWFVLEVSGVSGGNCGGSVLQHYNALSIMYANQNQVDWERWRRCLFWCSFGYYETQSLFWGNSRAIGFGLDIRIYGVERRSDIRSAIGAQGIEKSRNDKLLLL